MRGPLIAAVVLAAAAGANARTAAAAEWQVKPFVGVTFGGSTTFVDNDNVAGNAKFALGVAGQLLGEVFGIEGDLGRTPGFFTGGNLVLDSSVTTLTGNLVVAVPKRLVEYSLRPYVAAGGGLMMVRVEHKLGVLDVSANKSVFDIGGGVTGFVNSRVGVSWDLRYFHHLGSGASGLSFGEEQLSFWRAGMALAIRY